MVYSIVSKYGFLFLLVCLLVACDQATSDSKLPAENLLNSQDSYLGVNTGNSLIENLYVLLDGDIADTDEVIAFTRRSEFDCSFDINTNDNDFIIHTFLLVYRRGAASELVDKIDITDSPVSGGEFVEFDSPNYKVSCLVEVDHPRFIEIDSYQTEPVRFLFKSKNAGSAVVPTGDFTSPANSNSQTML